MLEANPAAQKRRLTNLVRSNVLEECLDQNADDSDNIVAQSNPSSTGKDRSHRYRFSGTIVATATMLLFLCRISPARSFQLSKHGIPRSSSLIQPLSSTPSDEKRSSRCLRHSKTSLHAQDSRQLRFFGEIQEEERSSLTAFSADSEDNPESWVMKSITSQRQEAVLVADVDERFVDATTGAAFFSSAATSSSSSAPSSSEDKSSKGDNHNVKNDKSSGSSSSKHNGSSGNDDDNNNTGPHFVPPTAEPRRGYGPYIMLSPEERDLFQLLRRARSEMQLSTTLRVAGGWVRDKLLATPEFTRVSPSEGRLTSKYKSPVTAASAGRQGAKVITRKKRSKNGTAQSKNECQPPVDIDIALDDMLGREFAEHLNQYLGQMGEKTHSVGVVLKNPEKSKHLETATMKVGTFWIDFVNLRAEEYTQDSRIPDLMRIGSPAEDAFRRDLTINSLFYNVNNGQVEDWTGRGFDDLRRGVVSTPLAPLTTLLDDPLRTLRSVRFAARLRFTMDDALIEAAMDDRVRQALAEKVSRERIGCEVDLMLRSPDPVGAMRLLINLNLAQTVFPIEKMCDGMEGNTKDLFDKGLDLLCTNHDQLQECKMYPPVWCNKEKKDAYTTNGITELTLAEDDEARRYLWYASFLKPLYDYSMKIPEEKKSKRQGKKANRSVISKLLVDELKRPTREAEAVEKIMKGANEFKRLIDSGCDLSAVSILLSDMEVVQDSCDDDSCRYRCAMNGKQVFTATENDPVWEHAMEFRMLCSNVMRKVGPLWRAALFLAMSEHIEDALGDDLPYVIEGDILDESQEDLREREVERYDAFATAMQRLGLVGIWGEKPLMDGGAMKQLLPQIPKGPAFRDVMEEQERWMTVHPCAGVDFLAKHLTDTFPEYAAGESES